MHIRICFCECTLHVAARKTGFTAHSIQIQGYVWTGLMFLACYNFLESQATVMHTWKGRSSTAASMVQSDQFLFGNCSSSVEIWRSWSCSTVQGITVYSLQNYITWLNLMCHKYQITYLTFTAQDNQAVATMLQEMYPSTQIIIHCTEFCINTPS